MALIEIQSLYKKYDGNIALKDINLKVERGEVFALIGPSGAGKTTLLRLIDLIDKPTTGKIFFDGIDTDQPERVRLALRRQMAFLQQKPIVFNTTVCENIAYGLKCRGAKNDIIYRKVDDVLAMIGLPHLKNRSARTLSGGEAQRVAIARALILEPEMLLLDELTANLDPIATAKIEELIADIIGKRNTTIILATHDMAQGQRLADRIGVLINGELRQTGRVVEIFNSPGHKDVAEFVGMENIIPGTVTANKEGIVSVDVNDGSVIEAVSEYAVGQEVHALIRPEDITLSFTRSSSSARNTFAGEITKLVSMGAVVRVEITAGFPLVVLVTRRSVEEMGLKAGVKIFASFKATGVHIVKRN